MVQPLRESTFEPTALAHAEAVSRLASIRHALALVEPFGGGPAPDLIEDEAVAGAWDGAGAAKQRCFDRRSGKLIGGISGPIQPFVAGLLFGPTAVGTYDALVRLARVSKILVGLLTSALLPVASRLDERGSSTTFQRLGELGLIMLPMFTLPPLAAAAILSPEILQMWIGPLLAP